MSEEFVLSERITDVGTIRKDADLFEKKGINPNLPEIIFAQDLREFIKRLKETIEKYGVNSGLVEKDFIFNLIKNLAGEELTE